MVRCVPQDDVTTQVLPHVSLHGPNEPRCAPFLTSSCWVVCLPVPTPFPQALSGTLFLSHARSSPDIVPGSRQHATLLAVAGKLYAADGLSPAADAVHRTPDGPDAALVRHVRSSLRHVDTAEDAAWLLLTLRERHENVSIVGNVHRGGGVAEGKEEEAGDDEASDGATDVEAGIVTLMASTTMPPLSLATATSRMTAGCLLWSAVHPHLVTSPAASDMRTVAWLQWAVGEGVENIKDPFLRRFGRRALEAGMRRNPSAKYRLREVLEEDDLLPSCRSPGAAAGGCSVFFDGGRGSVPVSLEEQLAMYNPTTCPREVIVIDPSRDAELVEWVCQVAEDLTTSMRGASLAEKLAVLAGRVAARLGDSQDGSSRVHPASVEAAVQEVAAANGGEVLLGTLRLGVCRHRALLFKLVCDEVGIGCRLVRGWMADDEGKYHGHAWNVVRVPSTSGSSTVSGGGGAGEGKAGDDDVEDDEKDGYYLVDVMNFHIICPSPPSASSSATPASPTSSLGGVLLHMGSDAAKAYMRSGGGSYGGPSVVGHDAGVFTAEDLATINKKPVGSGGDRLARSVVTEVFRARSREPLSASSGPAPHDLVVKQVLLDDEHFTEAMAYREVEIMRSVSHDCLIGYRHHFEHEEKLYIVMEYGSAGSVGGRLVSRPGAVDPAEACLLLHDVARGMAYLHSDGVGGRHHIAHRDLK